MIMGRGKFDFNMVAARRAARLVAVQVLYEIEISEKPVDGVLEETKLRSQHLDIGINDEIDDRLALPPVETDMDFCGELVRGVNANRYSIDEVIKRAMGVNRAAEQLEAVLRAILRAGAFELGQRLDIDPPITISEFVMLAERFFSEREAALVNGLLDRIARDLRPDEMTRMHFNARQR